MRKVKLPKKVTIGAFEIELITIPHEVSYEVGEAQGVFVGKPPYKIFLDEGIINLGGKDAVNVVIHEFLHVGYYQYLLKEKEEETVVNSYGNFITELLSISELRDWIVDNI